MFTFKTNLRNWNRSWTLALVVGAAAMAVPSAWASRSATIKVGDPNKAGKVKIIVKKSSLKVFDEWEVDIPDPCTPEKKAQLIYEASKDRITTEDPKGGTEVKFTNLNDDIGWVRFECKDTGEGEDQSIATKANKAMVEFDNKSFEPFDPMGLPAVFTAGIVTDVGELKVQISAQELDFQTEGPIICQALFQRLAPRAPHFGAQINYAGDRLEVYFDPAYTVTQGGVIFGTTSPSEGCSSDLFLPPTILFVDQDALGANDGSSWPDAFVDLQSALDSARANLLVKQIWVADGTYYPDYGKGSRELSFDLVSNVAIYGGFSGIEGERSERDPATNRTVLSGDLDGDGVLDDENSYHVVTATGVDATAILDGFVIEGGNANGPSDGSTYFWDAGGGLRCDHASPTIHDCDFSGNYGTFGGGVELFFGAPSFTHCTFTDNSAGQYGGGLHNNRATPTVAYCSFDTNSAGTAGGAARHISGGGLFSDVTFTGNSAGSGGALFLDKSSPKLFNAVCRGNAASKRGGALHLDRGSSPLLVNLLIEGNSTGGNGGAINNLSGSPTVVNCTLTGNRAASGGGVHSSAGAPTLSSTILYFNEDAGGMDESAQITVGGGSLTLGYSNVQGITGGLGGVGNIDGDPLFLLDGFWNDNGTPGDWSDDWWTAANVRIAANSPCIDAGDNAALPNDDADLDSDTITVEILPLDLYGGWRQLDDPGTPDTGNGAAPLVDIGAAEFEGVSEHNRKGDSNGDGAIDFADIDCFVAALISKSDWMACSGLSGDRYVALNDVNGDGTVDFGDIDPFVDCLINGGCK